MAMARPQNPPDRWLRCPPHGEIVEGVCLCNVCLLSNLVGTKFIPFKTPLDGKFDSTVPPAFRWTPSMVMEKFGPKLKYIIDLTKSTRYYDSTAFKEQA